MNDRSRPAKAASTSKAAGSSYRDAARMLALGCPVELKIPGRWDSIICWPEEKGHASGTAARLLFTHPEIRVDLPEWARPTDEALAGQIPPLWHRPVRVPEKSVGGRPRQLAEPTNGWPVVRVLDLLGELGYQVHQQEPGKWRTKCPYHGGNSGTSLVIGEEPDGRVWIHCFSGCRWSWILDVLGLTREDLEAPNPLREEARKTVRAILERIRKESAA